MSTGKLVLDELVRQMMEERLRKSCYEQEFIQLELPVPEIPFDKEGKRYIYDIDTDT